jgi:hypothetical protein
VNDTGLDPLTIWVGAIATLAIFTYLVKDNIFYRLVQHAALGVAVGVGLVIAWKAVLYPKWWSLVLEGFTTPGHWSKALWVLAIIPGALWYFQLSRKYFWVSTLVSGLFVGVAAGLAFKSQILIILPQISGSFKNLNPWAEDGGFSGQSVYQCFSNLVFTVALLTTLMYFFFSVKTDNVLMKPPMRLGRWMIMIALGAMFASTVMTRIAYLLERLQFLYQNFFLDTIVGGIKWMFGMA